MIKYISLLFLMLILGSAFSQPRKELEFNVIKPRVNISLKPNYRFLYQNLSHPIEITIDDSLSRYIVKLAGGSVNETDTGTYMTPEVESEVILNIYELRRDKEVLIRSKKFSVLSEPKPYLRNKPTDNTLLEMLLVSGELRGVSNYNGKKKMIKVESFIVDYRSDNGSFKSEKVIGDNLPIPIREEISKLPNGTLIYFKDIMIELMPGYQSLIRPYRITMEVIESNDIVKFKTGN